MQHIHTCTNYTWQLGGGARGDRNDMDVIPMRNKVYLGPRPPERETLLGQGVPYSYLVRCGGCCLSGAIKENLLIARGPHVFLTALLLLGRCGVGGRPITSGMGGVDFTYTWPAFLAPTTCDPTQHHPPYYIRICTYVCTYACAYICVYMYMYTCINMCIWISLECLIPFVPPPRRRFDCQ